MLPDKIEIKSRMHYGDYGDDAEEAYREGYECGYGDAMKEVSRRGGYFGERNDRDSWRSRDRDSRRDGEWERDSDSDMFGMCRGRMGRYR